MSINEPILQTEALAVPYPPRRCFNIYSAAQYCACKCAAIEQAIHDGELKAIRLGRGYVITRESLDSFIDAREAVEPHIPPSILARRAARTVNAVPAPAPKKQTSKALPAHLRPETLKRGIAGRPVAGESQ
jgi:excisionase family DNA binding protein